MEDKQPKVGLVVVLGVIAALVVVGLAMSPAEKGYSRGYRAPAPTPQASASPASWDPPAVPDNGPELRRIRNELEDLRSDMRRAKYRD
jgi:hypothetical protein